MSTAVVHARRAHELEPAEVVWIDRLTKWGNPFYIGPDGTRESVLALYEAWVRRQPHLIESLPELVGKVLVCYCKPKACHGDVLVKLLKEYELDD